MAWSTSFLCTAMLLDTLTAAHSWNLNASDTIKLALYNNTGAYTPDTALATQIFGGGPWSGNEITGTGWVTGGVTLTCTLLNTTGQSGVLTFTSTNVSSSSTTIVSAYGALIYDHTVNSGANYGIAGIYFGGAYTSTNGTFAINWGTANTVTTVPWWIST